MYVCMYVCMYIYIYMGSCKEQSKNLEKYGIPEFKQYEAITHIHIHIYIYVYITLYSIYIYICITYV